MSLIFMVDYTQQILQQQQRELFCYRLVNETKNATWNIQTLLYATCQPTFIEIGKVTRHDASLLN